MRLRRRNCAHPLPCTDSLECWPMAIHLRRSFLRYRPSASRSGRGSQKNRWRGSAPPPAPTSHANKLARLVLPPQTQRLATSAQPPGIIGGGFPQAALLRSSSLPLAPAHSAPGLEGGGKGARFPAPIPALCLQVQAHRQNRNRGGRSIDPFSSLNNSTYLFSIPEHECTACKTRL